MQRILIVEDHETLAYVLVEYLKLKGFNTILATSAEAALRTVKTQLPDLCLLDVSLPGMDGFDLSKEIRDLFPGMPIIFLTARGMKVDKLRGLMLQADDYLVKPVDEEELVLRIQNVLRRSQPSPTNKPDVCSIGKLVFDPSNNSLKWDDGAKTLTEKETAILNILCREKSNLVLRQTILKEVWGMTDQFTARAMDVHLTNLRKHLSVDPSIAIINVHGKGFILKETGETAG